MIHLCEQGQTYHSGNHVGTARFLPFLPDCAPPTGLLENVGPSLIHMPHWETLKSCSRACKRLTTQGGINEILWVQGRLVGPATSVTTYNP